MTTDNKIHQSKFNVENTHLPPCWNTTMPTILTNNPAMETGSSLSCLTSGGSTNRSTASEKIKKLIKIRKRPFIKPAKTSARTYP